MRGRLWIDAETYDVLRLDQGLFGQVDMPLPRRALWTMERWDTSIRFKPVTFSNPDDNAGAAGVALVAAGHPRIPNAAITDHHDLQKTTVSSLRPRRRRGALGN